MSHIFISYSRKDGTRFRDQVIALLQTENLSFWYDAESIQSGEKWRDSIDKALEEAAVMAVIVTPKALESHFVTYEWAWALGNGLEVIPLLCEPLPPDVQHPLADIQFIDCTGERFGEKRERILEQLKKPSAPLTRRLNQKVSEMVMRLRILTRVGLWLYPYWCSKPAITDFYTLCRKITGEARSLYAETLPDFWLVRSHSFTRKQRRDYNTLLDQVYFLWDRFSRLQVRTQLPGSGTDLSGVLEGIRQECIQPLENTLDRFHESLAYQGLCDYLDYDQPADSVKQHLMVSLAYTALSTLGDEDEALVKSLIQQIKG